MKNNTKRTIKSIILFVIMLSLLLTKSYAANTDYVNSKQKKEKGIGLAVIENEETGVNSYFYLYYDANGEVHTVQYMLNPMTSQYQENSGLSKKDEQRKYILKTDADNAKAKELGAKEYYTSEEALKKDENKTATKLYKKIQKKIGSTKTLYDYIEGNDDNLEPYTIESIIFNEVPLFDVNVFSDTAGGKEINEDSPIGIIRKLVAVWYVSLRNVTFVVLVILILYYGIRIAISTIASEKAHYKEMLLGWLKSLILTLLIHYIMIIIFKLNETLVTTFKKVNEDEGSIYNTIRTRAMEVPWKIGMPATILYLTLLLMWVRFIWAYFKRMFTVTFLIILAPLVIIRYAIQSASGRGSQMLSNWIQKFATAVFIQSIHAMLYVAFVENALKIALDSLYGFFISLFFLNFMLSADALFTSIFKFEFDPGDIKEMGKPFEPKKQLAGAYITYKATKKLVGAVDNAGAEAGRAIQRQAYKGYLKATDILDDKRGGNHRESIEGWVNEKLDGFDNLFIKDEFDENGNPIEIGNTRKEINDIFRLRKLSRMKGMDGATNKRKLKKKYSYIKKKYKGNFKIIKDIGIGGIESIFAVPVMVLNPTAGLTIMADAPARFMQSRKAVKKSKEKEEKYREYLNDTIHSSAVASHNADKIMDELEKLDEDDRIEAVKELEKVDSFNINTYLLSYKVKDYVIKNNIQQIDNSTLDAIVTEVVNDIPGDISQADRQIIKEKAINNIEQNVNDNEIINARRQREQENEESTLYEESNQTAQEETEETTTYSFGDVAEAIEDAVIDTKVDNRFGEMAKALDNIKDMNMKEENKQDSEGEVMDVNKFLNQL